MSKRKKTSKIKNNKEEFFFSTLFSYNCCKKEKIKTTLDEDKQFVYFLSLSKC